TTGGRKTAVLGDIIDFGDGVTMTFVHMNGEVIGGNTVDPYSLPGENGLSLGVLIEYHNFDLYIGGDLTQPVEKLLGDVMGDIDIYRVNHHGSYTSTAPQFIVKVKPEVSVISHGQMYGHPHDVTMDTLHANGSVILETEYNPAGSDKSGVWSSIADDNIFLTTDGCRYIINGGDLSEALYDCDVHCTHDVNPPLFDGLDAITDLGNGGELILSWDSASDTDNSTPITYNIYMSDSSGGQNFSAPSYDTRNESYTVKSLVPGTEYFFVVRSEDYYENEDTNLIELSATPLSDIRPPVFSGLASASSNGNLGEIQLYWSAASDNSPPVSYRIYRALTSVAIDYVTPHAVASGIGYTDAL
ncbi:MAG: fibronectin type III domain-containing protein, partial [Hyphomicrobiaceae bacterium]|nr:fibronectin type III domain-containing protein [Hyphomicrobiaceae bacterium]